jgi:hypothetical protein
MSKYLMKAIAAAVLGVGAVATAGCGDGSGSGPGSSSTASTSCAGIAGDVAVYAQFDQSDNSYTEGFDAGLASCEQMIETGEPGGLALTGDNSLLVIGNVSGGTTQMRIFNNLSSRGNAALDLSQDYVMPLTGMVEPEGVLFVGLGNAGSMTVIADAGTGPASTTTSLRASFLKTTMSSIQGQYVKVTQDATNGPVWGIAYDASTDRLFSASLGGVVTVFENFEAQVSAGTTPAPARTITPGAVDSNGHATQISGALHGLAYQTSTDTLVITDFDNAALYVVTHAGTAEDTASSGGGPKVVVPDRIVTGAGTGLSAPTDAKLASDGSLYVLDQGGKGTILRYENFLAGTSATPTPDAVGSGKGGVPGFLAVVSPAT